MHGCIIGSYLLRRSMAEPSLNPVRKGAGDEDNEMKTRNKGVGGALEAEACAFEVSREKQTKPRAPTGGNRHR